MYYMIINVRGHKYEVFNDRKLGYMIADYHDHITNLDKIPRSDLPLVMEMLDRRFEHYVIEMWRA